MSRDRRGNGIQEVDGSIPFGSTRSFSNLRRSDRACRPRQENSPLPSLSIVVEDRNAHHENRQRHSPPTQR